MRVGVVFPQTEIGGRVSDIRTYAQGVESLGFHHLIAYDHVVGADPVVHAPWNGPYDVHTTFHEPFTLFGYLAGITDLELASSIVILPQRQTALVAKQAAQVDLLCGGRFRLGVGIGWNRVEYDALGQDFTTRGRRLEEQVVLLRRLWSETSVSFTGEFDRIEGAGIAPLPGRPIPIWFGAQSTPAYERAGRLADGWMPQMPPGRAFEQARAVVEEAAAAAGRDPGTIGVEGRVSWRGDVAATLEEVDRWRESGATHVAINTMGAGLARPADHLAALERLAPATTT